MRKLNSDGRWLSMTLGRRGKQFHLVSMKQPDSGQVNDFQTMVTLVEVSVEMSGGYFYCATQSISERRYKVSQLVPLKKVKGEL